jgi:hypothetical protein
MTAVYNNLVLDLLTEYQYESMNLQAYSEMALGQGEDPMDLSTTLKVSVDARATKPLDLTTAEDALNEDYKTVLADGTGDDQADLVWHDRRTIAASSNDDLDLAGVLSDAFGDTVSFARIKGIFIRNRSDQQGTPTEAQIQVGGGSNVFASWLGASGDIVKIDAGGMFLLTNPTATAYAVTAGTGDILRVTNNDGSDQAEYDIIVIGATS